MYLERLHGLLFVFRWSWSRMRTVVCSARPTMVGKMQMVTELWRVLRLLRDTVAISTDTKNCKSVCIWRESCDTRKTSEFGKQILTSRIWDRNDHKRILTLVLIAT